MTRTMIAKIVAIRALPIESDSGEIWIDENGEKVPINRAPIDWECIKRYDDFTQIEDERYTRTIKLK